MTEAKPVAPKRFYTVSELMERWSVSRTTLWREVQRGAIKQTKVAGCVRFAASEVEKYENRN